MFSTTTDQAPLKVEDDVVLPYFSHHTFMRQPVDRDARDADVVVAGWPLDIATTGRSGARSGPEAIRRSSCLFAWGAHPVYKLDPFSILTIRDSGDHDVANGYLDIGLKRIYDRSSRLIARNRFLLSFGGDHSVSYPLIHAHHGKHGKLGLIHFDAHADLEEAPMGEGFHSHGTWLRNLIKEEKIDPSRVAQIGLRGPSSLTDISFGVDRGVRQFSSEEVHTRGPKAIIEEVIGIVGAHPVYFTFDIDGLDPSCAPGTGTPDAGGLFTWQARLMVRELVRRASVVGMDIVEVAPPYDVGDITSIAAAYLAFEAVASLAAKRDGSAKSAPTGAG